nr:hypothetical protein [Tanacetum cinerariifolium]
QAFSEAKLDKERFLKQKAKIEWLKVGDLNFSYFHKSVKSRNHRGRIDVILNSNNIEVMGTNVADVFVSHYQMFLRSDMVCDNLYIDGLFLKKVLADSFSNTIHPVRDEEIKMDMFSIKDERAPGPDGFSSAFFKKWWDIVGLDLCHAIRDFFTNGRLLKEINHAFIALVPKMELKRIFRYHRDCEELQLVNVCFTNDLVIFARGDLDSAHIIMESLDEFKTTSGLVPSIPKSTTFFCNVPNHVKIVILNKMSFAEGELPVKYLGVPLISLRLLNKDFKVLVEKAKNRIEDWKNKSLSFTGRLHLCKLVISSMHVY